MFLFFSPLLRSWMQLLQYVCTVCTTVYRVMQCLTCDWCDKRHFSVDRKVSYCLIVIGNPCWVSKYSWVVLSSFFFLFPLRLLLCHMSLLSAIFSSLSVTLELSNWEEALIYFNICPLSLLTHFARTVAVEMYVLVFSSRETKLLWVLSVALVANYVIMRKRVTQESLSWAEVLEKRKLDWTKY